MSKQWLRKAITTGVIFAVSVITYPVWGANPPNLRPGITGTAIVEANAAAEKYEKTAAVVEQPPEIEGETDKTVFFPEETMVVTRAEWEAVAPTAEETQAFRSSDFGKNANRTIVAKAKAHALGLDPRKDKFIYIGENSGKSEILVSHGEQQYILTISFIPGKGWVVVSSRELTNTVNPSGKIITGTVKLDLHKLADFQTLANHGYQTWRLDPLQAAKYQGQAFGFDRLKDSFTLMPDILPLRERGETAVLVQHGKKYYLLTLVQPFGNTQDKIWTISGVRETNALGSAVLKPVLPASGTIYHNTLLDKWSWSKHNLPKDMAFTAVVDLAAQRENDKRFRDDIWQIASAYDHRHNVLLLAYLGAMPTNGYDIGIKKVSVRGQEVTVHVAFKSPARNQGITAAETYPFDVVLIPKDKLPSHKNLTIKFVDPNGKLLTTVKINNRV